MDLQKQHFLLEINETDIPYEEDILNNKYSVKAWFRYIKHKQNSSRHAKKMLYERSLKEVPGSYKIWYHYLVERKAHVKNLSPLHDEMEELRLTFERAMAFMHKMPRIWIDYLTFMMKLPSITKTRQLFDRCLRSLPITQHHRIWPLYLQFVTQHNIPETIMRVFRRYLQLEPHDVEKYIDYLMKNEKYDEAAIYLAKAVNDETFVSKRGKTSHQIWIELCDLLSSHSSEITSIKAEPIIRSGIQRFSDMVGNLWVALAGYFIRLGLFERARDIYEEALETIKTVRDFTLVFDAYSEYEERMVVTKMESLNLEEDCGEDDVDMDIRIYRFENLMDRRPFLLSAVLLRQNPHNINEWLKRAELYSNQPLKVIDTFSRAVRIVNPFKATGKVSELWVAFAKFYENHGQLSEARTVFDQAITKCYRRFEDLGTVWCQYVEMELRNKFYNRGWNLIKQATNQHVRLAPGDPIWQLYLDLEECMGTFESTKALYHQTIDMKVATPLTVLNFAKYLQSLNYYEESFKAYERGISIFKWPQVYDIHLNYINDFIERNKKSLRGSILERARDIFEHTLEKCPPEFSKTFFLLYSKLEEEHGFSKRTMNIYERAITNVIESEKLGVFRAYIKAAGSIYGITKTREIYEKALETLGEKDATTVCLEFSALEVKLGEVDRARAIYNYGSQFNDPRVSHVFWKSWNDFEVSYGNESTFRDMLRLKRSVQAIFITRLSVDHARQLAEKKNTTSAITFLSGSIQQPAQSNYENSGNGTATNVEIPLDSDDEDEQKTQNTIEQKEVPSTVFGNFSSELKD